MEDNWLPMAKFKLQFGIFCFFHISNLNPKSTQWKTKYALSTSQDPFFPPLPPWWKSDVSTCLAVILCTFLSIYSKLQDRNVSTLRPHFLAIPIIHYPSNLPFKRSYYNNSRFFNEQNWSPETKTHQQDTFMRR